MDEEEEFFDHILNEKDIEETSLLENPLDDYLMDTDDILNM
jgi:hypothetical protein